MKANNTPFWGGQMPNILNSRKAAEMKAVAIKQLEEMYELVLVPFRSEIKKLMRNAKIPDTARFMTKEFDGKSMMDALLYRAEQHFIYDMTSGVIFSINAQQVTVAEFTKAEVEACIEDLKAALSGAFIISMTSEVHDEKNYTIEIKMEIVGA